MSLTHHFEIDRTDTSSVNLYEYIIRFLDDWHHYVCGQFQLIHISILVDLPRTLGLRDLTAKKMKDCVKVSFQVHFQIPEGAPNL